jgi:CubicO group peptidase (beta-lactamase class C family)
MNFTNLDSIARHVVMTVQAAPAATVAARLRSRTGVGAFGTLPDGGVAAHTFFDLASVTKPFVAVTAVRLARRKELAFDEPLVELLPCVRGSPSANVPLELFLSHRAGLVAHQPLFESAIEGAPLSADEGVERAAHARRADCLGAAPRDGFPPVYSDMGFMLVGRALVERSGLALDELVRREVTEPLGVAERVGSGRQLRRSHPGFDASVAPTEVVPWRGGVVRGEVHDENAMVLSGDGLSGHAGLFGDAPAVLAVGGALLDATKQDRGWLGPDELATLTRRRPGGTLLAGFDGRSREKPSSGSRVSAETFGHLGFTGTSLWVDPVNEFVGVLLTNRVHPTREHIAIREARPAAYDAMFDALCSSG